jgi:hypothetical protein
MRKRKKYKIICHYSNDNVTLEMVVTQMWMNYIHKTNKRK